MTGMGSLEISMWYERSKRKGTSFTKTKGQKLPFNLAGGTSGIDFKS